MAERHPRSLAIDVDLFTCGETVFKSGTSFRLQVLMLIFINLGISIKRFFLYEKKTGKNV